MLAHRIKIRSGKVMSGELALSIARNSGDRQQPSSIVEPLKGDLVNPASSNDVLRGVQVRADVFVYSQNMTDGKTIGGRVSMLPSLSGRANHAF